MMSDGRIDLLKRKDELKRPLILDGALGSLLQQRGIEAEEDLWMSHANLFFPKTVVQLHREYIQAGADIITTNTFRTNPFALKSSNEDISDEEFVRKSVELARVAREREEMDIIIAGSNSSAEDCYQKERTIDKNTLEYNHKKHIELLWENGVDIIWNETHSHLDEIEIICEHCSSNNLPFVISLFFDESLRLLSGETLTETVNFISKFSPAAIGFNCVYPEIFKKYFSKNKIDFNWGVYLNCGSGDYKDEEITCGIEPESYLEEVKVWLPKDPVYVGSCCGSTPEHTKFIKEYFDEFYRN